MMDSLSLLYIALAGQMATLGGLLIYTGLTRDKRLVSARLAKIKFSETQSAKPIAASRPRRTIEGLVAFLWRDIPDAHKEQFGKLLLSKKLPHDLADIVFAAARVAAAIGVTLALYGLLLATIRANLSQLILFGISAAIGLAVAIFGVRRLTANIAAQQREALTRRIPYALELILIFLDAGLGLTTAIERVADALVERQPDLNEELRLTLADLRVLGSQDLAFKNMAERIDTPSMHSIVNILRQSIQYGSPISEAMQNAIGLMRRTEILLLEEQANKLPSKITLATLLFIFPPFIIILAGPAMIGLTAALTEF